MSVLAIDIGGTNLRYSFYNDNLKLICKDSYRYDKTENFETLVLDILSRRNFRVKVLLISAAGPIDKDKVKLTNSNIQIDKKKLIKKLNIKEVHIFNDFYALAKTVPFLNSKNLISINNVRKKRNLNLCLIGAGTGLGQSFLYYNETEKKYNIIASEGGHILFPFKKEDQKFEDFLIKEYKLKNIEIEDILSGSGLEKIYHFLSGKKLEAVEISMKFQDSKVQKTFDMFSKFLARASRIYCIENLAFGGVYIGGGVIQKNLDKINKEIFIKEFLDNQNFKEKLEKVPLKIIKDNIVTLDGLLRIYNDIKK